MNPWEVVSSDEGWTVPGYVEERQLGQGASGVVVAAVSETTGQRVAIKYLSPALVQDPGFMWGFRAEAQTLRALDVPQVVQLYDYVEEPQLGAAIVMELVDGVSLHEMISQRGPTGPESALAVMKGSLLGLAAAHGLGVVHRDYKPENVLVDAQGESKLTDFGIAVMEGKKAPAAGTPLYMAPEQWNGAPSSPATDIYAVAAVFFECLTGRPPFSGKLSMLRQLHETASVPLDSVNEPLRGLIARGMAKNPADRPQNAIAFVSELEAAAAAAYGFDWEERGRSQLAERVAALLPLLLLRHGSQPGAGGTSAAASWFGGGRGRPPHGRRRRRALLAAAIGTAAVVAVAATATAVTLSGHSHKPSLKSSATTSATVDFTAQAAVAPPVSASKCTTTATFTYSGTLTASGPGTLSYQWVYSAGAPGPVRTAHFAAGGHQQVSGGTVKTKKAGSGWAELKLLGTGAKTSNKASYKRLCASSAGGISTVASISPSVKTVACGTTAPPTFTADGSITSKKAEKVTYYWALSDGYQSAPATLAFSHPGTLAAAPLPITPGGVPSSGEAVLVTTSPAAAASAPAAYTLNCTPQKLTAAAAVSPAMDAVTSCSAAAPAFTFTGTITASQEGTVSYHWKLPSGSGPARTLHFAAAGSQPVTAASYKPASDTASGSGSIVVTSPSAAASNAAVFKLTCGQALAVTINGAATATVGQAYSATATATGGKDGYTWSASGVPAGLKAKAAGGTLTISGRPTDAGSATIKFTVADGESPARTSSGSLAVTISAPKLVLTGGTLPGGTAGSAYDAGLTASGGTGGYTWSATGLPAGLAISASSGTISGTPTGIGTSSVSVTVTDGGSPKQTASAAFSVTVSAPKLTFDGGTLGTGTSGVDYSATVAASGGFGALSYSATGLPAGLAMSSAGTISGTPSVRLTTTYPVSVTVTDAAGQTATASFSITIDAPVVVTPPPTTPPASPSPSPSQPIIQ